MLKNFKNKFYYIFEVSNDPLHNVKYIYYMNTFNVLDRFHHAQYKNRFEEEPFGNTMFQHSFLHILKTLWKLSTTLLNFSNQPMAGMLTLVFQSQNCMFWSRLLLCNTLWEANRTNLSLLSSIFFNRWKITSITTFV